MTSGHDAPAGGPPRRGAAGGPQRHVGHHRSGPTPVQRRRRQVGAAVVTLLLVAGLSTVVVRLTGSDDVALEPAPVVATSTPSGGPTAAPDAEAAPGDGAVPVPVAPAPPAADPATVLAGILAPGVPDVGSGAADVVPGVVAAPDPAADVVRVKVSVEGGLPVDGAAFAAFVMATLNDPRSWAHDGYSFERVESGEQVEVVLASPQTSAAMCAPLQTLGTLSCRNGGRAVITHYRWVNGSEDYVTDPTGYRTYVVNHEVGHFLGHGHVGCPGAGLPAPVMMQQTKGIGACVTNPFPYP